MSIMSASDSVHEQLKHARVTTVSMAHIILNEDVDKILNNECLKQVIDRYKLRHMRASRVVTKIAGDMMWKKTFALLLYLGTGDLIEAFIEKNFRIPVKREDDKDLRELIPREEKRSQFFTDQRMFDAPVFEFQLHSNLVGSSHLPFLEEEAFEDQGANSKIFAITVPRSNLFPESEALHQLKIGNILEGNFANENNVRKDRRIVRYRLIRKELEDNEFAEEELTIHKELNHQCIIPLFTSYQYRGKFNLLLPKCGKRLKPYFQENTSWSEAQYLSAIHGLSDALKAIHNLSTPEKSWTRKGCHGDLKPNNVLVDYRKFTLIDFGLTRIRQPSESSGGSNRMTGPYAAPECFNSTAETLIESYSACDIWSFGCILAELVVFMDSPSKHVFEQYEKDRRSIQGSLKSSAFHKFGQHNNGTWTRLDAIEKKNNQSPAIRGLIGIIRGMLQIDHWRRPNAQTVTDAIAGIMEGRPGPGPILQSATGSVDRVQSVIEPTGNNISPSIASANQSQAALQSRKSQIGPKVEHAYALFDRPREENRKAELEAILQIFLDGQTELARIGVVDDPSLHRRIQWGLMVTEKELSYYKRFDLAIRLEHIRKAERYCDGMFGIITSQDSDASHVVRLRLESYIIKGMTAMLEFKGEADKDQIDSRKEEMVGEIDQALRELKAINEVMYTEVYKNISGWRDRIARPLIRT